MALSLQRHGLQEEAVEQLHRVLRTAPFEYWEWHEAARQLGEHLLDDDPAEAAELIELSLLDDLRTWFYLLNDKDYLHTPSVVHRLRARAAIAAGYFEMADRQIQMALAASPGATRVAEELVPLMERTGQKDRAEELFQKLHQTYQKATQAYPDCAVLHNNLAWLSARCSRRLEEALAHAERAVELAPESAANLDTLAEVHFRLGDRDTAVRYSRRAVELQPRSQTLRRQLKRFEECGQEQK
jgi:tetratricopeptide (TPR) repeat protein